MYTFRKSNYVGWVMLRKTIQIIKYFFSYDRELRLIVKKMVAVACDKENRKLRVLDVGCGTTSMLSELAGEVSLRGKCHLVGLDVYGPTIEWNRVNGFHDEYVLSDIREHDPVHKYDVVVATDLIEHFGKDEAYALLKKLESMAGRSIILITPNGYRENTPQDGNFYMEHKCGFNAGELRSLNYAVYGAGGFRFMRGMYSLPWGNKKIMNVILYFVSRLLRYFPRASYHLVAAKNIS
ncbi:bifunctional 2-polyprenyl-6-hydroxyphenol methylase/3-demethylubiquinol 3-O-methyltransferase UbiG [Pseudomonas sp. SJZ079]|uniref:class I SAM-dependent methyltransferase n=1 Tax=Pseudomonas sp. SJZ079 TaxID=2572887 RepID=UPI0015B510C5|nr:methyltransferase domain-containing protein [Pseudomonas sp. SJZ079]